MEETLVSDLQDICINHPLFHLTLRSILHYRSPCLFADSTMPNLVNKDHIAMTNSKSGW